MVIVGSSARRNCRSNALNVNLGLGMKKQKICRRCNQNFWYLWPDRRPINCDLCMELIYITGNKNQTMFKENPYIRETLEYIFSNRCARCNKRQRSRRLCIDHVIPLSSNGRNDITNFQLLCSPCNTSKRDKIQDYRSTQKWMSQRNMLTTTSGKRILNS